MSWLTRILGFGSHKPAGPVARPHKGGGAADAEALYNKLDAMKTERHVPHTVGPQDGFDATKGMAKELMKLAAADGKVSSSEAAALADIADQRFDKYGGRKPNDLPLIGYTEAMDVLRPVITAPNQEARDWWAKVASQEKPTVTLAMARELAVILLKDGNYTSKDRDFSGDVMHQSRFSHVTFSSDALTFLGYIGATEQDLRSYKEDPRDSLSASQRQLVADAMALHTYYVRS